jgi:hypothetical protein
MPVGVGGGVQGAGAGDARGLGQGLGRATVSPSMSRPMTSARFATRSWRETERPCATKASRSTASSSRYAVSVCFRLTIAASTSGSSSTSTRPPPSARSATLFASRRAVPCTSVSATLDTILLPPLTASLASTFALAAACRAPAPGRCEWARRARTRPRHSSDSGGGSGGGGARAHTHTPRPPTFLSIPSKPFPNSGMVLLMLRRHPVKHEPCKFLFSPRTFQISG